MEYGELFYNNNIIGIQDALWARKLLEYTGASTLLLHTYTSKYCYKSLELLAVLVPPSLDSTYYGLYDDSSGWYYTALYTFLIMLLVLPLLRAVSLRAESGSAIRSSAMDTIVV